MGLLEGQRGVVTGGASGIGRATCRAMAREGARVAVLDINGDGAAATAAEVDGRAWTVDVTDAGAVERTNLDAASWLGGLTTLFNNAGRPPWRRSTSGSSTSGTGSCASTCRGCSTVCGSARR